MSPRNDRNGTMVAARFGPRPPVPGRVSFGAHLLSPLLPSGCRRRIDSIHPSPDSPPFPSPRPSAAHPAMDFAARAKTVAAATARSLAPWLVPPRHGPLGFVLERNVDLLDPPAGLQEEWAVVRCDTRKAYGCGEHGQAMLDGLTVYARLITSPDIASALYIHANDDALRGIKADLGCDCRIEGPGILTDEWHWFRATAFVQNADDRFVFFVMRFRLTEHGERQYYLIYDSVAASLSMVPLLPEDCHVAYTVSPLPVPLGGGGYELLLLSQKPVTLTPERRKEDVVCVWTPDTGVEEYAWQMWKRQRTQLEQLLIEHRVAPDVMFSLGGKAFWVDLRQGLVHCDWLSSADIGLKSAVDFGFIPLPPGCPPDLRFSKPELDDFDFVSMTTHRTCACVNGGIRFVYIDHSSPGEDTTISVWDFDLETKIWKNRKSFLAKELWRLWTFKKEGLPETEPRFPTLLPDGTLCLLMPNKPKDDDIEEYYICSVELSSNLSVLWSARLGQYHNSEGPLVLPSDFFCDLGCLEALYAELGVIS